MLSVVVWSFEWWGASVVICLERDADLHMAQLMPLPLTVSCFSKIQIGFTFLVSALLGSPGRRAVKRVCVCVCVCVCGAGILFSPSEVGQHLVNVLKDGEHIANSPFKLDVSEGNASKVKAWGQGLEQGTANELNQFTVDTKDAGLTTTTTTTTTTRGKILS